VKWLEVLDTVPKLVRVGIVAGGLLGIGWTGHSVFEQQIGLPGVVRNNVSRITNLETWRGETVATLDSIRMNAASLRMTNRLIDSLFVLESDTYCLVRAHTYDLDPDIACRAVRR